MYIIIFYFFLFSVFIENHLCRYLIICNINSFGLHFGFKLIFFILFIFILKRIVSSIQNNIIYNILLLKIVPTYNLKTRKAAF